MKLNVFTSSKFHQTFRYYRKYTQQNKKICIKKSELEKIEIRKEGLNQEKSRTQICWQECLTWFFNLTAKLQGNKN